MNDVTKNAEIVHVTDNISQHIHAKDLISYFYDWLPMTRRDRREDVRNLAVDYYLTITDDKGLPIIELDSVNKSVNLRREFLDPLIDNLQKTNDIHQSTECKLNSVTSELKKLIRRIIRAKDADNPNDTIEDCLNQISNLQNNYADTRQEMMDQFSQVYKEILRDVARYCLKAKTKNI